MATFIPARLKRVNLHQLSALPFDELKSVGSAQPVAKSAAFSSTAYATPMALRSRRTADLRPDDVGLALATQASVWLGRCVQLRSRAVARIPWRILNRRTGQVIEEHAFHRTIQYARIQYRQNLLYNWEMSKSIHGEAYLEKLTIPGTRIPGGLCWLNPIAIEPYIWGGRIEHFDYSDAVGSHKSLAADAVVFDRYANSLDDFRGEAPAAKVLTAVNIHQDMQRYIKAFFLNDATPGGYLAGKQGTLLSKDDEERLIKQWNAQIKGADNAHGTILLPAALDYYPLDNKPPSAQSDLSEEQRTEICAGMEVPKAMVDAGDVKDPLSAGGTMDSQTASWYEGWVMPECIDMAEIINTDILPWLDPWDTVVFEWDFTVLIQLIKGTKERSDKIQSEYRASLLLHNEAREEMGRKPIPELDNMLYVDGVGLVPVNDVSQLWKQRVQPQQLNIGLPGAADPTASAAPAVQAVEVPPPPPALPAPVVGKSVWAGLTLPNHPDLIALQNQCKQYLGDAEVEWNDPAEFHVTLLYAPAATDAQAAAFQKALNEVDAHPMELTIGSLKAFEGVGQYPLHFRIRQNNDLLDLQDAIHGCATDCGMALSAFSNPDDYTPHITMGYAKQKPKAVTFKSKLKVSPATLKAQAGDLTLCNRSLGAPLATSKSVIDVPVQTDVDDELDAWEKKVRNKGAVKAATFVCQHLDAPLAMYVKAMLLTEPSREDVRVLFDEVRDAAALKAYPDTRSGFKDTILGFITDAQANDIQRQAFAARMRMALRRYGLLAFRDGMNKVGYDPESFSQEELGVYRDWERQQSGYVTDFGAEIFKQGITETEVAVRAEIWTNASLDTVMYEGMTLGAPEKEMRWNRNPEKDSCETCIANDGQVKTLKDWRKAGMPKSRGLACGGFHCGCGLEEA